jgi:hypothetical protein
MSRLDVIKNEMVGVLFNNVFNSQNVFHSCTILTLKINEKNSEKNKKRLKQ